jgi:hypothetical protein
MIEFMHEDLPDPVAPEMRMWGISARFSMTARPAMSRPMATSRGCVAAPLFGVEDVAERDELACPIRHLDADGRLARYGRQDAHVGRGHGVGDVLGQAGHAGHLHAGTELELVAGDGRPDAAPDQPRVHAVGGEGAHQLLAGRVDLALVEAQLLGRDQGRHRRQHPFARGAWGGRDGRGALGDGLGLGVERDVDVGVVGLHLGRF